VASRNRVTYKIDQRFPQWGEDAVRRITRGLATSPARAASDAQHVEVAARTGDLRRSVHVLPVQRVGRKIVGGIGASDYKANWYEMGTHSRRSRASKTNRASAARRAEMKASGVVRGVKGLHYLRKGLYANRGVIFAMIGEALRDARGGRV
jgi:hypothetical protein